MMAAGKWRRPSREELVHRLHRGLRPKLKPARQDALALITLVNLDAIAARTSDPATMLDWVEGVFTWRNIAEIVGAGQAEMAQQVEVAMRLVQRWKATGAVRFDGPDLQLAKDGVGYMEDLAKLVDRDTAMQAAMQCDAQMLRLRAELSTSATQGACHD